MGEVGDSTNYGWDAEWMSDRGPIPEAFEPSFMLFRAALVQCRAAERCSRSRIAETRLQEADACATVIVLTQASIESWVKSACVSTNTSCRRKTPDDYWQRELETMARESGGVPSQVQPPSENSLTYLRYMKELRNYLLHGDVTSRDRVARWFSKPPSRLLAVPIARLAVSSTDEYFRYAALLTGMLAPSSARILEVHPRLLN